LAKVLMVALMSFKGQEGFIRAGQKFEAENARRAEDLERNKLAAYYEEEGIDIEELLKDLNSHAKVDQFAADHGLTIPSKDDGAKLEERKEAIAKALENAAQ
jgi:transketolase